MSVLHVLRPSFAGGEADPALAVRSDLAKFNTFLKKCRNFFIHPQGGASNRPGTFFLASTKSPDKKSRLIPFEFSTTNCYVMEFGDGYIRFFTEKGVVLGADGQPYEVQTPYAENDLEKIAFTQSADVVYLACEGIRPKMLTRYGHDNWTFEDYPYKNGPYLPYDGEAKGHFAKTTDTEKIEFIALDYTGKVYTSAQGENWTLNPKMSAARQKIISANSLFFKWEDGFLYSSADLMVWRKRALLGDGEEIKDVCFGNGFYVAWTNSMAYYSADCDTWALAFDSRSIVTEKWDITLITALNFVNERFVAVVLAYSGNYSRTHLFSSSSPAVWEKKYAGVIGTRISKIYYSQNRYLFTPYVYYSDDLTSLKNSPGLNSPQFFQAGADCLIGFASDNSGCKISYSLDAGSTWSLLGNSPVSFYHPESYFSSDYANGKFYFAGSSGSYCMAVSGNIAEGFNKILELQTFKLDIKRSPIPASKAADKLVCTGYIFDKNVFGRKYKISKEFKSSNITKSFGVGNNTTYSDTILSGGGWIFQTNGTWSGVINLEVSKDGENWSLYRSFSSCEGKTNYNVAGNFDEDLYFVRMGAKITGTNQVAYVDFSAYSFTAYVYLNAIGYDSANVILVSCEKDTEYIKDYIDEKEGDLYVGSWSEASGWPSTVCIFQGRVCWGKDFTIDATKVEEYTDFGVSIPLVDSDAISTNVRAGGLNAIQHLVAGNRLLAFTSGGEFASNSDVFTPSSCGMTKQTNRGASLPRPVIIGQRIIYAQAMGTVLRDFSYNFESDGYDGDDLCVLSRHLFSGRKIVDMAYQQEPDSLLWVLLSDGTLLCCTYMREQEVLAWSQMETDGRVESICCIPGTVQNDLYLLVKRGNSRFVERMAARMPQTKPQDQIFLDACIRYSGGATKEIVGLSHLEGREVGVLCNGSVSPKKTVKDGKITLDHASETVVVGLPYVAQLITMPVDMPLQDGTLQDRKSRPSKIFLTVTNTVGAFVGQTGQELREVIFREWGDKFNEPLAFKSATYEESLASVSQYNPTVTIEKRTPLPITVVGIVIQQRI